MCPDDVRPFFCRLNLVGAEIDGTRLGTSRSYLRPMTLASYHGSTAPTALATRLAACKTLEQLHFEVCRALTASTCSLAARNSSKRNTINQRTSNASNAVHPARMQRPSTPLLSLHALTRRITWLPKACRNAAVRQQVAEAVIKAICGVTASETTPDKVVVRARRRRNHTPSTRVNATNTQASARARTRSRCRRATR